jgi:hypothetical protein
MIPSFRTGNASYPCILISDPLRDALDRLGKAISDLHDRNDKLISPCNCACHI